MNGDNKSELQKIKENCRKVNSRIQTPTLFSQKRTLVSGGLFSELELLENRTIENRLQKFNSKKNRKRKWNFYYSNENERKTESEIYYSKKNEIQTKLQLFLH